MSQQETLQEGANRDDLQDPPPQQVAAGNAVPGSAESGTAQPATGESYWIMCNGIPRRVYFTEKPKCSVPDYFCTSLMVLLMCNICAGFIACGFSIATMRATKQGKMEEARTYWKGAMVTCVVGFLAGIVTLTLGFVYLMGWF